RDVLIGGRGLDYLFGQEDDDLLIGGATTQDNNTTALGSIMAVWASPQSSVARLAGLAPLLNRGAVTDDGSRDVLTGDGGRDWFLDYLLADTLVGFDPNPTTGDRRN